MTGTADTEAFEFQQIYHLETVVIPTHMPMVRKDENDLVFRTFQEKVDAIITDIKDCYERGQPVLVGTTSIENSELLSQHLEKEKLPHEVLNAKQHAREAEIVAQAGKAEDRSPSPPTWRAAAPTSCWAGARAARSSKFATTSRCSRTRRSARSRRCAPNGRCATTPSSRRAACTSSAPNGTNRGASTTSCAGARDDRATRARSRFYLSLEDPLLRIFGGERLGVIMQKLKMPEGEPIEHPIVNRSIAKAQNARRVAQLRHQQAAARIRRRRQRPAARDLPAAQRAPRERGRRRHHPQHDRAARSRIRCSCTCRPNRSRSSGTSPASRAALAGDYQMHGPRGATG